MYFTTSQPGILTIVKDYPDFSFLPFFSVFAEVKGRRVVQYSKKEVMNMTKERVPVSCVRDVTMGVHNGENMSRDH